MYVAIAAASWPWGDVTTASARIPSVVSATVVVFLFFNAFQRVVGRQRALAGAMLIPMSFLWLDRVPSAEIDMLLVMWVSASLLAFWRALELEESHPVRGKEALGWWLLALLCVAAGFLTKWTAPAFFYLTVLPLLAWRRKLALLLSWRHLAALGLFVAICLSWAYLVSEAVGWPALRDAFMGEAAQRFNPAHAGRTYPVLESLAYPFEVLAANLPWSLLALYACRASFVASGSEESQRLVQMLHCWIWPNLLFWSLPAQHHVRYSLPICPAISALGILVLFRYVPVLKVSRWQRTVFIGLLLIWVAVKIIYVEVVLPPRTANRHVRETAATLAQLVPVGQTLYLGRVKDEGILFYYNRPARCFLDNSLPSARPIYALLIEAELPNLQGEITAQLHDQQGAALILVRIP